MGGGGYDPARLGLLQAPRARRQALGQVDAVGGDRLRQPRIGAHQQEEVPPPRDGRQPPAAGLGVRRAERAVDDAAALRQPSGDRLRLGRALRIGEEQQRRQALPPGIAAA
jgi:hypothetical protein